MTTASEFEQHSQISAVVLAGGAGSRIAFRDKAQLLWQGRPFLEHILQALQPQAGALLVNSNRAGVMHPLASSIITDAFAKGEGPLSGMLAGLKACDTEWTQFVPCDNPRIAQDLVARLRAALMDANADIAYATTPGRKHYLYALMRTGLHSHLQAFLNSGQRAVRHWYAGLPCVAVDFSDCAECFANINTEADYALLAH